MCCAKKVRRSDLRLFTLPLVASCPGRCLWWTGEALFSGENERSLTFIGHTSSAMRARSYEYPALAR
jgi:hypothetical protein